MATKGIKAYLFSIGESTTEISKWSLERLGFEVVLIEDPKTSFSEKYEQFLKMAKEDGGWVVRTDADIVHNKHFGREIDTIRKEIPHSQIIWWQFPLYCCLRHEIIRGAPMFMSPKVIRFGQKFKNDFFRKANRPETKFYRQKEINQYCAVREMESYQVAGLHGYAQNEEDVQRVLVQKNKRNQLQDWDLKIIERLKNL